METTNPTRERVAADLPCRHGQGHGGQRGADDGHEPCLRLPAFAEQSHAAEGDGGAARDVFTEYAAILQAQLARILRDGMANHEFAAADATVAAILDAAPRFHHPQHVRENAGRNIEPDARRVLALLPAGLRAGATHQVNSSTCIQLPRASAGLFR